MAWSVFDGTDADSREDLFRFSRLKTPHAKAVFAGLDRADDADWYIGHALDNGFRPEPSDVVALAGEWGFEDVGRLVQASEGTFSQKQVLDLCDLVDPEQVAGIARHVIAAGTKLDDAAMCEICEYAGDASLADALAACRVADKGPYTASELSPAYDKPCIAEHCSHKTVEALLANMRGRFTCDQAMDFMTYHVCDDYTDDTLEALLAVTDCDREEADMLLFGHGYSRRPDPLLSQPAQPASSGLGLLELVGVGFLGHAAWSALRGGSGAPAGEPAFQDFNHAWGSDNDHNWQADGDMRWDSYGGL